MIFSFANILVLKPLPLRDPDGLAWVFSTDPHSGPRGRSSFADYQSPRDRAQTLESLAATTDDNVTLTGRGEPMRLNARRVTGNFFDVWGLRAAEGRLLRADEDEPGGACTLALSDHLWASLFQRDPSIVSTSIAIDGRSCTVVGVVERDRNRQPHADRRLDAGLRRCAAREARRAQLRSRRTHEAGRDG